MILSRAKLSRASKREIDVLLLSSFIKNRIALAFHHAYDLQVDSDFSAVSDFLLAYDPDVSARFCIFQNDICLIYIHMKCLLKEL